MEGQRISGFVGRDVPVRELVEVLDQDLLEDLGTPDQKNGLVEDVDAHVWRREFVVDCPDALKDVLFAGRDVVEASEEEEGFVEGDFEGLPEGVVLGVQVVQDEEKENQIYENHLKQKGDYS